MTDVNDDGSVKEAAVPAVNEEAGTDVGEGEAVAPEGSVAPETTDEAGAQ